MDFSAPLMAIYRNFPLLGAYAYSSTRLCSRPCLTTSKLFINVTTITLPFVEMEDCLYHSIVRGHHVYKSVWTPYIGEVLPVQEELGNEHDSRQAQAYQESCEAVSTSTDDSLGDRSPEYNTMKQ